MIAAKRRRIRAGAKRLVARLRAVPARSLGLSRRVDRAANRALLRIQPPLAAAARRARTGGRRWGARLGRRLRPVGVLLLRLLGAIERRLLWARSLAARVAGRARAMLTLRRAICLMILAAAVCLLATQFVEYRAVEVGGPAYDGLPASAPTKAARTAGSAHAYLLVPVALLAAALALAALRNERRRGLGRVVFGLGLLSLAVVLLVDLPAGLDAGVEASRFSGATAVLYDGFYAELAAAAGLMLGGALLVLAPKAAARYHARPCRTRTNSFARVASALRRRRRRRASSRARGAKRASRRRKDAASAPASPR
jgi:hypothetical protein